MNSKPVTVLVGFFMPNFLKNRYLLYHPSIKNAINARTRSAGKGKKSMMINATAK
ncbi:MAG: hypothetical protein ACRD8Z_21980 [Nitrososphaeraceae archaeon]